MPRGVTEDDITTTRQKLVLKNWNENEFDYKQFKKTLSAEELEGYQQRILDEAEKSRAKL